ncbi:MAG TPA: hypothetical protein DDZ81_02385 [Acetobacteraceae bacterium]|jgi:hypothetical protein|nr:hypothetical protein [Acetobacteraceae bacterium]
MGWKTLAILPLIFLGAGAAPPEDCMHPPDGGQALPIPLDLAGRPVAPGGLTSQTYAAVPAAEGAADCRSALPVPSRFETLRSETTDVLHGLPSSETLRRIDEPRRAPAFQ